MAAVGAPRSAPSASAPQRRGRGRKALARGIVIGIAYAYVIALAAVAISLRVVGERWWLTAAVMYVPRLIFAAPMPLIVLGLALSRSWAHLASQVIAMWIVVRPLMGFVWTNAPKPAPGPVVRVISYNVDSGHGGMDAVAAEIDRLAPDVVLLQEIGDPAEVQRTLGPRFSTIRINNQFVIATRFTILSQTDPDKIEYGGRRRSPRFMQYLLETPLGTVAFYNVHPISARGGLAALRHGGWRRSLLSGHWPSARAPEVMTAETGLRETQVADFAEAASRETLPVVIAGDTNLPDLSRALVQHLSGYQDAFVSVGRGFGYTFPTRLPWMRIDRIMASDALRFVSFRVGQSRASDHLCVAADLQRK